MSNIKEINKLVNKINTSINTEKSNILSESNRNDIIDKYILLLETKIHPDEKYVSQNVVNYIISKNINKLSLIFLFSGPVYIELIVLLKLKKIRLLNNERDGGVQINNVILVDNIYENNINILTNIRNNFNGNFKDIYSKPTINSINFNIPPICNDIIFYKSFSDLLEYVDASRMISPINNINQLCIAISPQMNPSGFTQFSKFLQKWIIQNNKEICVEFVQQIIINKNILVTHFSINLASTFFGILQSIHSS